MTPLETDRLVDRAEAAKILGCRPQTLASWACLGNSTLRMVKVGRLCRYRLSELQRFIEERSVTHGGELIAQG